MFTRAPCECVQDRERCRIRRVRGALRPRSSIQRMENRVGQAVVIGGRYPGSDADRAGRPANQTPPSRVRNPVRAIRAAERLDYCRATRAPGRARRSSRGLLRCARRRAALRAPYIQTIGVVPTAQRRGIGHALLTAAATREPGRDVALATQNANTAALALNQHFAAAIEATIERINRGTYRDQSLGITRGDHYRKWIIRRTRRTWPTQCPSTRIGSPARLHIESWPGFCSERVTYSER